VSIDVVRFEGAFETEWNDLLERMPGRSPFHRAEALSVLAEHAGQRLHPLVGYKGQEPVGLFPVFTTERGPIRAVFSPPPRLKVSYLGPVVADLSGMSPNSAERRRRRFVDAALQWLTEEFEPRYANVRTAPTFEDPRPFDWAGFDVTPRFTYEVDLTPGPDALLDAFSRDARSNIWNAEDTCSIHAGEADDLPQIVDQVRTRYEEQGLGFPVSNAYVCDLHEALPERAVRPYVCTVDGDFAGGSIVLDDGERVYGWLGSVVPDIDHDVNDLLHCHVIRTAAEEGRTAYDLVGANDARLSRFKSKFAPQLRRYHELSRAGPGTALAERVYRRVSK